MDAQRWRKIKNIFDEVLKLAPEKRAGFLTGVCADDEDLRAEIENLLASFDNAESFMENPAVAEAASMFEDKKTLLNAQTTENLNAEKFVAGTILENRYRIIGLLGKGGMGEVFRAEDLKLKQEVALKFLPEKLEKNEAALERFIGEVRTARQVSHANVCKVFDIGETNGKHFLSMEFVDGDDLSSLLRRIGRLPSDKAAEISRQICFGLHAIHEAGILHRDLKPANIIIDSKGKARITDFGIAGLESEILNEEIRVGTPAYMSPEQITGREVTARSDIYSLGLLLYEIFTGKQAFKADSIDELIKKHQTTQPANPSEFIENINPIVEKTINRCLEKNPSDRPQSALQVALALPGGNPLEAAIAAGETPSPEMVAAAPKKGALKPLVASGLLLAFFALFISIGVLHQRHKTYNLEPLEKSPEVLAERSRSILQKFGYTDAPIDTAYHFEQNDDFLNYADANDLDISQVRKMLGFGQPSEFYFLYRQSPRFFEPKESGNVSENEPPMRIAKMANVKLDPRGRLLEFLIVPPSIAEQSEKIPIDWNRVLTEAGFDILKFRETEAKFTPPFFADERRGWEGSLADLPEVPVRIEAAAFDGKPVYFRIVAPWNDSVGNSGSSENAGEKNVIEEADLSENASWKAGVFLIIGMYCFVIIGSVFLARRNLKVGRGDLVGAIKLTTFLFLLRFAGEFFYADHVPTVWGELVIIYQIFAHSLITALFIGLTYIALEPFVRRHWSELLISWNRLLAGDFRDPLVGRDVLIGGLLGIGHTVGIYLGSFLVSRITGANDFLNSAYNFQPVNGFSGIFGITTGFLAGAISTGFILLFILLGIFMLSRRKNLSVFLIFLLLFTLQSLFFVFTQHWIYIFSAVINCACFAIALSRFGLVGAISFWMCFYLSYLFPVTFNSSSLYFPNTIVTFAVAFGLAIYGFYTSLAGQSVFRSDLLADSE